MAAPKKHRVTLSGGLYQRGSELFKAGDKLTVTEGEINRFPGKFIFPGGNPAGEAAVVADAVARADAAEARVAELEAALAAATNPALKTTPEGEGSDAPPEGDGTDPKDEPAKDESKGTEESTKAESKAKGK